jgi:hypothetical protein
MNEEVGREVRKSWERKELEGWVTIQKMLEALLIG